jgi:hypothetical protein
VPALLPTRATTQTALLHLCACCLCLVCVQMPPGPPPPPQMQQQQQPMPPPPGAGPPPPHGYGPGPGPAPHHMGPPPPGAGPPVGSMYGPPPGHMQVWCGVLCGESLLIADAVVSCIANRLQAWLLAPNHRCVFHSHIRPLTLSAARVLCVCCAGRQWPAVPLGPCRCLPTPLQDTLMPCTTPPRE